MQQIQNYIRSDRGFFDILLAVILILHQVIIKCLLDRKPHINHKRHTSAFN